MFLFDFCGFPKSAEAVNSKMTGWCSSELNGMKCDRWYKRTVQCQSQSINLQKSVSIFFYFIGCLFIDLSSSTIEKNRHVTCCVRGRREKSIENKRIRRHSFVPCLSGNVLTKLHGKSSNLHTLLIRWNFSRSKQNIILSNSTSYNLCTDI